MSYGFTISAPNKAEAKQAVSTELDKVVAQQPIHGADRPSHQAVADALVDLLKDDAETSVEVYMCGSIMTDPAGAYGASVTVNATLIPKA